MRNRALRVLIVFHRPFKFRDHTSSWSQQTGLGNTDFKLVQSAQRKKKKNSIQSITMKLQTNKGRFKKTTQKQEANENAA